MNAYSGSKKILVAEYDDEFREIVCSFIESMGHEVIAARTGGEAIRVASSRKPDLVLIDLSTPKVDGLTTIRRMRSEPELSEIPIVATSADGGRGIDLFSNIEMFGPGRIDYLPKPFSLDGLGHQIDSILGAADSQKSSSAGVV